MLFCTKLTFDAFWEWGLSFLDWEWRWKSMNSIPTLQIQRVQRGGTKSKVAEEPTLKSALRARPWQVGLSFVGFLEIPKKHQRFVHCWSFEPNVCVWGQTRYHSLLLRQIPLLGGGQDSPSCLSIPVIQRLLQVRKTHLELQLGVAVTGCLQQELGSTWQWLWKPSVWFLYTDRECQIFLCTVEFFLAELPGFV